MTEGVNKINYMNALERLNDEISGDFDVDDETFGNEVFLTFDFHSAYYGEKKVKKIIKILKEELNVNMYNWTINSKNGDLHIKIEV